MGPGAASASVCVLGQNAKTNLLGYGSALGKFVKVNDNWLQVIGVLAESVPASTKSSGGKMEDLNNIIYIPFNTLQYRFWDMSSFLKDELDGIDRGLKAAREGRFATEDQVDDLFRRRRP